MTTLNNGVTMSSRRLGKTNNVAGFSSTPHDYSALIVPIATAASFAFDVMLFDKPCASAIAITIGTVATALTYCKLKAKTKTFIQAARETTQNIIKKSVAVGLISSLGVLASFAGASYYQLHHGNIYNQFRHGLYSDRLVNGGSIHAYSENEQLNCDNLSIETKGFKIRASCDYEAQINVFGKEITTPVRVQTEWESISRFSIDDTTKRNVNGTPTSGYFVDKEKQMAQPLRFTLSKDVQQLAIKLRSEANL